MNPSSMVRNITDSSDEPDPSSSQQQKAYERYLRKKQQAKRSDEISKRIESNSQRYGQLEQPARKLESHTQQDYVDRLLKKVASIEKELLAEKHSNAVLQATNSKLKGQLELRNRHTEQHGVLKAALERKSDDHLLLERKYAQLLERNRKLESALLEQARLLQDLEVPSPQPSHEPGE